MAAKGKSKKDIEKAKEKEAFDAAGLEAAKKELGAETKAYKLVIEIQPPGLLQNSAEDILDVLDAPGTRTGKKGEEEFDWKAASYLVDDRVVHPAWHVRSSFTKAAKEFQIAGKGKKTYNATARATLFVEPELIPLRYNGGIVTEPTKMDERRGNTSTNRPMPVRRPLFCAGHRLEFLTYVNFSRIDPIIVRKIAIVAGREFGIGDYRPEFGRFELMEFTPVNMKDYDRMLRELSL